MEECVNMECEKDATMGIVAVQEEFVVTVPTCDEHLASSYRNLSHPRWEERNIRITGITIMKE